MERIAIVRTSAPSQVEAYLPENYELVGITPRGVVVIAGEDKLGWTLEDYVIPRLGSGNHFAIEVTP